MLQHFYILTILFLFILFRNIFKWWLRACLVSIFKNYFLFLKKTLKTCLGKGVILVFCISRVLKKPLLEEQKKKKVVLVVFFTVQRRVVLRVFFSCFLCFPTCGFSSMVFWRARPQVEKSGVVGFSARVWEMLWGFRWRCGLCCGISGGGVSGAMGFSTVVWTVTVDWIRMGEEKERRKKWLGVSDKCDRRNERKKNWLSVGSND